MSGKPIENSWTPIALASSGAQPHNVERPDCHHMQTIWAFMQNNAIPASERASIDAQLAQPCEQCAQALV